jgi:hypothetical protein
MSVNAIGGSAEGGTQAMIIDNSGNVGIGTTSPIGNLSVVRDTVVAGSDTYQRGMFYKDGKLQITPPDLYNGYPLNGDFLTTTRYKTDGTTDYTAAAFGVDYDTVNGSRTSLYFKTASSTSSLTEKMRITGDGEVIIGDTSTTYDPATMGTAVTSTPTNPILHVNGSIQLKSDNDAIVIGNGNATFLKDEELHFGWGGGWYMNDANLLRVVNNKKIYSTGAAAFGTQLLLDVYGGNNSTNCLFIGTNTGSQNLRIGVDSTGNNCWIQSHAGKPLRLNPAGNAIQYGTSNTVLSDDRIKDNETYIENATDTLIKLKPQIYDKKLIWNISKLDETSNISVVRESGLITQDVWYDAPELRHLVRLGEGAEPGDDKPYTDNDPTKDPDYSSWGDNVSLLEYVGLVPYLIKSIQELQERIKTLENPPQ